MKAFCPHCQKEIATPANEGIECPECGFFSYEEIDRWGEILGLKRVLNG